MQETRRVPATASFIIGAADLAFVLIFFFIMVGGEFQPTESVQLPTKTEDPTESIDVRRIPVKVIVERLTAESTESQVTFEYLDISGNDTLMKSWARAYRSSDLQTDTFDLVMARDLSSFVEDTIGIPRDSVRVAVYSSPISLYGIVASVVAACKEKSYDCHLIFRIREQES